MMGKAKTGTPNAPLHTGYGAAPTGQTHRSVPIWAIAAGAGAIIAFLLSGVLYWTGRETKPAA
jgi:hypothetical protein